MDEAILEAQRRGEFANLRGQGKPLPAELLSPAGESGLASHALTSSGFRPAWLELRLEIDRELAECRRLVERVERFPPLANRELPLIELRHRLEAVRNKARRYNLLVPSLALQRSLPRTGDLMARMERAVGLGEGT